MDRKVLASTLSVAFVAVIGLTLLYSPGGDFEFDGDNIDTFESEEEFRSYLESGDEDSSTTGYAQDSATETIQTEELSAEVSERYAVSEAEGEEIDVVEPEYVVEDGESIYYSSRYPEHLHIVDTDLNLEFNESSIGGELLLHEDLVISVGSNVTAYHKNSLEEEWSLETDSRLETVRYSGDTLTVVTRERIDSEAPCPVRPARGVEVACSSVYYHPGSSADYTYNIMKVDAKTGEIEETAAFTADWRTEIEVTPNEVYASYSDRIDESEVVAEMLLDSSTADQELKNRIEELKGYDISDRSMQIEIERAMENLVEREGEEVMDALEQDMEDWDERNMREYETSHVLRFNSELESESLEIEGQIRDIEDAGDSVIATSEVRGISRTSERDIHRVEDFEVVETHEDFDGIISSIETLGDGVLLETREGLEKLDQNLETVEEWEGNLRSFQIHGDRVTVIEQGEVTEEMELEIRADDRSAEEVLESHIKVLDSDLEELHSETLEGRYYRLGDPVGVENQTLMPVRGSSSPLVEVSDSGIELVEVESSSNQLFHIGENLYFIERDRIVKKDLDYNRVDSIELARERDDRYRTPVEPMPR